MKKIAYCFSNEADIKWLGLKKSEATKKSVQQRMFTQWKQKQNTARQYI